MLQDLPFQLQSDYTPKGDQPEAIAQLEASVRAGNKFTTLLGVTGSGKTYTVAQLVQRLQRPALVIAHNKTLAAQLCNEYKGFFPDNAVGYFVSYYDYYQPEAYIAATDTYIEKDASINDEIDRMRHAATQNVLLRRDSIVVASVSCIYGLGSPDDYEAVCLRLETGGDYDRDGIIRSLIDMQYDRTGHDLESGRFRVRGGTIEIIPADRESIVKLDFLGDDLERISIVHPRSGEVMERPEAVLLFPATHYVLPPERLSDVLRGITDELNERFKELREQGKELEANRLWERTQYDMEMIREMGYCHGIENYSRHFDGRKAGDPPYTLIDYFPPDLLVIIDESHVTIPQLRAMANGDRSRKRSLVDHGFRLPSAYDNRPLAFEEFIARVPQIVFVSATPGPFEQDNSAVIAEQVIRPTGLVDPSVEIRPTKKQMENLLQEINAVTERQERVLVTTLTKRMAEDLTEYLLDRGVKARYMHSDVDTLDRIGIIFDLRQGVFDVLVGINLLREGLDLPEVSLVAILDADKEGFLRSDVTLIQTMGRAARNVNGRVILYGDKITGSMQRAVDETNRRRAKQLKHNRKYKIQPETVKARVHDRMASATYHVSDRRVQAIAERIGEQALPEISLKIQELEREMWKAADELDYETAAALRDQIVLLKKKLKDKGESLFNDS